VQPEKTYRALSADAFARVFAANTVAPALIAKHMLALMPKAERSVFAALSARVGSISDNRLGGWHAYRASKAALNMLIRNFAIEQARRAPGSICVGLHPGTVDTGLSKAFQGAVPGEKLFTPEQSAGYLLDVIDRLSPEDSGKCFDWAGKEVPA
jgi:NAD(P)-dependent dehydrogenase (short-subunit alcohol dehydrogenase family)